MPSIEYRPDRPKPYRARYWGPDGRLHSRSFDIRIDPASLGAAERLRVEEGEAVVVRRMIRYVDGEPWSVQDSSYPMDIAQQAGLLVNRPGDGRARPRRDRLPRRAHHPHAYPRRGPDPRPVAAGVPVLAYVRTCYTKERPVRLTETIFAGDRNRLVYELGDLEALYERDQ